MKYLMSLLLVSSFAAAEPPAQVAQCLARPLELGAAITARFPEVFGGIAGFSGYGTFMRLMQAYQNGTVTEELGRRTGLYPDQKPAAVGGRRILGSPSEFFLANYRSVWNPVYNAKQYYNHTNLASNYAAAPELKWNGWNPSEAADHVLRKTMGYNMDADGAWQVEALLNGQNRKYFDAATTIFAVDLFYWDTGNGDCVYTHSAEMSALRLIQASKEAGKVLFIGTVPLEDGSKVPINSKVTGIEGVWYPNNHVCAANVNEMVHQACLTENGCYIVDLATMAATLNADHTLFVKSQNRAFNRRQMRPDGVHVSEVGAKYVMEQMVSAFEANPPASCR